MSSGDLDSQGGGLPIIAIAGGGVLAAIVGLPLILMMGLGGSGGLQVEAPTSSYGSFNGADIIPEYLPFVEDGGTRCTQVSSALIAAQIEAESGWDPDAESPAGAWGLAQFMPDTWTQWGKDYDGDAVADAFNPADAIGSQADYMCYLAQWVEQQQGLGLLEGNALDLTLAAYNAGLGNVSLAKGVPKFPETEKYIRTIGLGIVKYSAADGGASLPPGAASSIVEQAKVWLGTPYVWGGGGLSGPTGGGLDCSGLVRLALYSATGIELPRTANQQARDPRGTDIPRDYAQMRPGDIVAFSRDGGGHFHHIGIYAGAGQMVHAPVPGKNVEIVPLQGSTYYENFYWTIKRYTP